MLKSRNMEFLPRLIFWELTKQCNLKCLHCRANASDKPDPGELNTQDIFKVMQEISGWCSPIIVLSGGEPLLRKDIFEIIKKGVELNLKIVVATEATIVDDKMASDLKKSGVLKVSVSIDGSSPEIHDEFRGMKGSFEKAVSGIKHLLSSGMPVQINTSVTKKNIHDLKNILGFVKNLGVQSVHIFLLVPTGRGKELEEEEISPMQYEEVLEWFAEEAKNSDMDLKATCAPHFYRIAFQKGTRETREKFLKTRTRGCLAGIGVCFISAFGEVYPCGYLPVSSGNVKRDGIRKIWEESELFNKFRKFELLKGKCGICEFRNICGGCRARAYVKYGDYLESEPYCIYVPERKK